MKCGYIVYIYMCMSSYPDNYVKDLSLQILRVSEQRDASVGLIDAKHAVVPCSDEQHTNRVTTGPAQVTSIFAHYLLTILMLFIYSDLQ